MFDMSVVMDTPVPCKSYW